MMSKRFVCGLGFPINSDNPIRIINDKVEDKDYYKFSDICKVLNEQYNDLNRYEITMSTMVSNMEKLEEKNAELERKLHICINHLLSDKCNLTIPQLREIRRELEK